jgi:hypothetical protein
MRIRTLYFHRRAELAKYITFFLYIGHVDKIEASRLKLTLTPNTGVERPSFEISVLD